MARMAKLARGDEMDARLDAPEIVPTNYDVVNPGGTGIDRTCRLPLAPLTEKRTMFADRAHVHYTPGASYANFDPQKGGAPGAPGAIITSDSEMGQTLVGAAPQSPIKLTTGMSDWAAVNPSPAPAHTKISRRQNPNAAQTTIGIWANEGTPSNTNYEQPAPWAAGIYIG